MARRRAISEELIFDKELNSLSVMAENLFYRMLSIADDCGVVPATPYTMAKMLNLRPAMVKKLDALLHEIVDTGLGRVIEYNGKPFFAFKLDSFLRHQGHILNKRTRSEYLKIEASEYDSQKFPDFPSYSSSQSPTPTSGVESRKKKVESREQKETAGESSVPDKLAMLVGFNAAWTLWLTFRRDEKKKPVTPSQERKQLEWLSTQTDPVAILDKSIRCGWQGLFELKDGDTRKVLPPDPGPRMKRCDKCGKDFPSKLNLCPKCYPDAATKPPPAVAAVLDDLKDSMRLK
jgi:hypothetical protein